ncbi:phosphotransferase [Labrys monachus]|uniref:Aminoglycoside phosphotransferase domain-containing protein n=1 Tax=Labrys monachus TaxID=217067 RepID=A0ABU0F8T3_9HYPH|nr:phosphotransferase [Labrys monachus]MDQ0391009.1 hypothetical protein [Labrys monachus]
MSMFEEQRRLVEAGVRRVPGWEERRVLAEPAIPVLASPSWRGVDGSPWRVRDAAGGESLFVKLMDADAAFYIDVPCAFEAARRASALGIGPTVFLADAEAGLLVMEDLDLGWTTGTLDRLLDPGIVDGVVAARRRFQEGPPLPRSAGVFEEIARFHADAEAAGAQLPADAGWLVEELRLAAEAVRPAAERAVPVHGDGNVSNILIGEAGEIRLVDWDRATNADPLEDLGSFLVEAFDEEPEARDAFARMMGGFDEKAFNRAWIYGVADDLRWGLIGTLVAAKSPRKTFEFHKFASWRFVRCRMAVQAPRFGQALRRI